ncbi:hypothetical protein PF008_g21431 [Phytophthora fragariae]|uniref:Uncharacterized protein n=1 Tax=Phytophthora fragariae TaxID=53985 RepID=A0A6G0QWT1_9STRA|nr:hypothetical protein PF003_g3533 [Phytophthora fragariae]KAE9306570.1 hypothetical protein PF008_g21431 [Phytophthora fragariae]
MVGALVPIVKRLRLGFMIGNALNAGGWILFPMRFVTHRP